MKLIFEDGQRSLFEFRLVKRRTTIGRSDLCDVSLPGEELSREHCILEERRGQWILNDCSRHGTFVNGQRVQKAVLREGDSFKLGVYQASLHSHAEEQDATAEVVRPQSHEFIYASEDGCLATEVTLQVTEGPLSGRSFVLRKSVITVGNGDSDIALDSQLMRDHCRLRISRGRPMIEPGPWPVFLDGQQINSITPVYSDEEIRIGQTAFKLETQPRHRELNANRFGAMVGASPQIQQIFGMLKLFAGHDFPVLLQGETGTGKELAARAIHDSSARAGKPFVPINCGSIPENLIESELFGYEKGAFSGAISRKDGAFQAANGGTLFLDELGELPLSAQVKLLRALESMEIRRVGATHSEFLQVRIIAATHRDLFSLIREGNFREDLLFRLHVLSAVLPPLRDRPQDIDVLAKTLAAQLRPPCELTDAALSKLRAHRWPGNGRELRNVLQRASVLGGRLIEPQHLQFFGPRQQNSFHTPPRKESEREVLQRLLLEHRNNRSAVARALGVPRTTLLYRLRTLGLESKL